MLHSLSLRNFVIVKQLDLDFTGGFTVLTGETGAGKSILIEALSLVLGERGGSGLVRAGCTRAEISVEFYIADQPEFKAWLEEHELPGSSPEHALLRRVIYDDGRSRGFINGVAVTLQQMREVGDFLVDIYSQHAYHSLLKPLMQRALLDEFAGSTTLAAEVAAAYKAWRALCEKRQRLSADAAAHAMELAYLRDQVRELQTLNFTLEDWQEEQMEHKRQANITTVLTQGQQCHDALRESDNAIFSQLTAVTRILQDLTQYDAIFETVLTELEQAMIHLEEADDVLKKFLARSEMDPERYAQLEQRLRDVFQVARKYRLRPEDLPDCLTESEQRMAMLNTDCDLDALEHQEQAALQHYRQLAESLSLARQGAAQKLSHEVSQSMQQLAMVGGAFEILLTPLDEYTSYGQEEVQFRIRTHATTPFYPLAKVASGGELSRVSLAIRVCTARYGGAPIMIFDEVDVGIGGGVAEIVGQLLQQLGATRQVLVITHLAQVAACAKQHLRVHKSSDAAEVSSAIDMLSGHDRVEEIARMMGGMTITDATRNHASEMLLRAQQV